MATKRPNELFPATWLKIRGLNGFDPLRHTPNSRAQVSFGHWLCFRAQVCQDSYSEPTDLCIKAILDQRCQNNWWSPVLVHFTIFSGLCLLWSNLSQHNRFVPPGLSLICSAVGTELSSCGNFGDCLGSEWVPRSHKIPRLDQDCKIGPPKVKGYKRS